MTWAQQERVNDAEDRAVRADAERERNHRHQGEAGILYKHPRAMAQVLPKIFNPSYAASVTAPLLRLLHPAESLAGGKTRLLRTHPQPDVLLGLSLDVVAQFLVQFALGLRSAQQRPQRGH